MNDDEMALLGNVHIQDYVMEDNMNTKHQINSVENKRFL